VWLLTVPIQPAGPSKAEPAAGVGELLGAGPCRSATDSRGRGARWFFAPARLTSTARWWPWGLGAENRRRLGWPSASALEQSQPNAATCRWQRKYAGTVMVEGTTLSEGRGTTRAAEMSARRMLPPCPERRMQALAPHWHDGCRTARMQVRAVNPKNHAGGPPVPRRQHHFDDPAYDHAAFRPWRLTAGAFKALRQLDPITPRGDFPYEFDFGRLAIDLITALSFALWSTFRATPATRCAGAHR